MNFDLQVQGLLRKRWTKIVQKLIGGPKDPGVYPFPDNIGYFRRWVNVKVNAPEAARLVFWSKKILDPKLKGRLQKKCKLGILVEVGEGNGIRHRYKGRNCYQILFHFFRITQMIKNIR